MVGALWAVSEPRQHVDVGQVEGRGQQISGEAHKLVEAHLDTEQNGRWSQMESLTILMRSTLTLAISRNC